VSPMPARSNSDAGAVCSRLLKIEWSLAVTGDEIVRKACKPHLRGTENLLSLCRSRIDIPQRKLSHEVAPTEIERSFNCYSFRSCLMSPQAIDWQRLSFDVRTLELCVSIDERYGLRRVSAAELPEQGVSSKRDANDNISSAVWHLGIGARFAWRLSGS